MHAPLPPPSNQRFALGRLVATPGALAALADAGEQPLVLVTRHASGDWGDVDNHDRLANEEAVAHEGDPDRQQRVFSVYVLKNEMRLYCITEWDRSVTTLLRADEY